MTDFLTWISKAQAAIEPMERNRVDLKWIVANDFARELLESVLANYDRSPIRHSVQYDLRVLIAYTLYEQQQMNSDLLAACELANRLFAECSYGSEDARDCVHSALIDAITKAKGERA